MDYKDKFLNEKINAAFPVTYFIGEGLQSLIDTYAEDAPDARNIVKTLYLRQDTNDPESRRAAGTSNESPMLLINNRMLIVDIFPSLKIWEAIQNGDITDIEVINNEDLETFKEENRLQQDLPYTE